MDYEKELQEIGFIGNSEILQIIKDENRKIIKTYTISQLVEALQDYEEEMKNAEKRKEKFLKLNETQGDINKDGIMEKWKQNIKKGYERYKVSNFGRVKYINYESPVPQKDENGKIGYLVLDKELFGHGITGKVYVYRMVADTWLEEDPRQSKKLGSWHVHHITNNGYDNSLENLIVIRQLLHYKIHALAKKFL